MSINGISAGYYPTDYASNKTAKAAAGASFSNQLNSIADNAGNKGHIVYMKTDDMLYSGGNGTGLSFYLKYAEGSTEDDPIVIAKGTMTPQGGIGEMGLHDRSDFMQMFEQSIKDMTLLREQKAASYYKYSMKAYWDFMNMR